MHVHCPCLGALLKMDLTVRYFRPKGSCFDVPGIHPSVLTPLSSGVFQCNKMSWSAPHRCETVPQQFLRSHGSATLLLGVESCGKAVCIFASLQPRIPAPDWEARLVARSVADLLGYDHLERPHVLHLFAHRARVALPPSRSQLSDTRAVQASDLVSSLLG